MSGYSEYRLQFLVRIHPLLCDSKPVLWNEGIHAAGQKTWAKECRRSLPHAPAPHLRGGRRHPGASPFYLATSACYPCVEWLSLMGTLQALRHLKLWDDCLSILGKAVLREDDHKDSSWDGRTTLCLKDICQITRLVTTVLRLGWSMFPPPRVPARTLAQRLHSLWNSLPTCHRTKWRSKQLALSDTWLYFRRVLCDLSGL